MQTAFTIVVVLLVILYILSIIWVVRDAYLRGTNWYIWAVVALVPIVGVIAYCLLRPPMLQIDKDEQLRRFTDRQNTPEKQWKITDEDWRNREKWDEYENAVDEMLMKTSTKNAPWNIIEANNKLYARIKVMNIIIDSISEYIKNSGK